MLFSKKLIGLIDHGHNGFRLPAFRTVEFIDRPLDVFSIAE